MNNFADLLIKEVLKKESSVVVGLDPNPDYFPLCLLDKGQSDIKTITDSILAFNKMIIDVIHPHVLAVKPQLAYYEVYGSYGIYALEQTICYAKSKGLLVINDAKRGDIGPTAIAYAKAFLGDSPLSGDAVTVNPYLGRDGITPFLQERIDRTKGIFVLLKTSNPSASDLQDLQLKSGEKMYQRLAETLDHLAKDTMGHYGYSNLGVVVGATYPQDASYIRSFLKHSLFLVPGYGAQGGKAEDLSCYFDENGMGALISSTRAIIYSYMQHHEDWTNIDKNKIQESIEISTLQAKEEINAIR
ncbi:orotidine-5'-phosphate decarboxylase [Hazenella sp. IB182357]|uniref:Orotidine 5'-phosphate decarboxylase n=1 Tax=Polycladospora coralii TaxID=2771432 RepID=A0A926RTP1_9BACL|nr:orotidine-5'-phosphate decarboxylase [Polycladospora coralii]MBD1371938.1 orotidine-5'-phosphate decarboxylase [Polycladospora coralii]